MIEVVAAGPLTTVQDAGRIGYRHLGVPAAGPADWFGHALANRLVGNPAGAAALECTVDGPRLRFTEPALIAVAGGGLRVGGTPIRPGTAVAVAAGQLVAVGRTRPGVRAYLAVAGGIAVSPVLGSRSTDTLAGIGPAPLRAGDVLPIGRPAQVRTGAGPHDPTAADARRPADRDPADPHSTDPDPADSEPGPRGRPDLGAAVRVLAGPHGSWVRTADLVGADWTVSAAADRVGVRLAGPALTRHRDGELPVTGMLPGAVQVPPGGQPIVLLANCGPTGGYPVAAAVITADLPLVGQARPGGRLRFAVVDRDTAVAALRQRVAQLDAAAGHRSASGPFG